MPVVPELRTQAPRNPRSATSVAGALLCVAIAAVGLAGCESGHRASALTSTVMSDLRPAAKVTQVRRRSSPAPPPIVQSRIPFPSKRKAEMERYATRHYGLHTALLKEPKVIVEHYTGSESYSSAYATFARDVPDPELHELPGLCAHFVIDARGTIHQLVSLHLMCRHTVGLNWTAVGIEHVGTSDHEIFSRPRQIRASLRLTRWLQAKLGIKSRNVIGHSESLRSPFHRERVAALAHQTHGDFKHSSMKRYRRALARSSQAHRAAKPDPRIVRRKITLGHSVRGRPVKAVEVGNPAASRRVLVVGSIHGDEPAGITIARRLKSRPASATADLWILETLNPDGAASGTRQNAHGVDLNRNFPWGWRHLGRRGSRYYSGPRSLSEPESRIAHALIRQVRPTITIWFHQPYALVEESGGRISVERRFARLAGLRLARLPRYPGTATSWQNHRLPSTTAFVVELPPGSLSGHAIGRYAHAVRAMLRRPQR
jgi:hypothetical protein